MTYQVSISGHSANKEDEAKALDTLRVAVENLKGVGEVYNASASTSHHGSVDLKPTKAEGV